ncbi:MAG: OFA family MFS transporter [Clostridiales bacterium]|jgi:OFA family oxalate/formate antiporter-like MFS transporter|nr:OFA family MFS transporter [Clostridiales bacterium]
MRKENRLATLIATIAIQLCFGVAYIWSVFQTGIANSLFNGDNALASLAYSLLLAFLTVGSVIGGKLTQRISIRYVVMMSGVILAAGFFLSGLVTASAPWVLWITYGCMGGIGMGFSYTPTIACAQKWFPDKKGLVTGLIVASLGFGGVIFTPMVEALIKAFGGQGVGELKTFMVLAGVFFVVCIVGSFFIKNPSQEFLSKYASKNVTVNKEAVSLSPTEVLRRPQFYMLTLSMMLACMGGLMMIGFAKPIAVARGMGETAVVGVLLISIFNALGRLTWGLVSDKIGRKATLAILLFGTAIIALFVNLATGNWIFVLIGCIGFFYGGLLSNYPAVTSDLFGPKHMATNYGMVLLGFGIAAVSSSYIAGYYKNLAAADISLMAPAFTIAACCAAVSLVLLLVVTRKSKASDEASPAVASES